MDKATATQLANIEKRTGKSLRELTEFVNTCGLEKHGEIRDLLKRELGMGHGDANALIHFVRESDGQRAAEASRKADGDILAEIYSGPKAALRGTHDRLMSEIEKFGPFEIAPKKGYVSLRRRKQFAMIGPATKTQIEIGLNAKDLAPGPRLVAVPPGGMCQYKVRIENEKGVDRELIGWLRRAYDAAS